MKRRRALLAALNGSLLCIASCGRGESPPPAPSVATTVEPPDAETALAVDAATATELVAEAGAAGEWAESMRLERWDEAARTIDALPEAERARPETRYARARAALAKGEHALAAKLLQDLDAALPLMADAIALHRAEAKLSAGPFADAAEYFAARPGMSAQLHAAEAYEKAKEPAKARAACDRVIAQTKKRGQEAEARAIRFRLVEKPGPAEIGDARWLAVHAPDLAVARSAIAELPKLDPAHPLTAGELMIRATALRDALRTDDALKSIDDAATAAGPPVAPLERLRAKGYALYQSKSHYVEAAKVLAECAAHPSAGADAAEDAFHAARSLSRADKDDEAIAGYDAVAKKYPRSKWGDRAAYFVPYLHLLHAEWDKAQRGFDDYVRRYPDGVEKDAPRNRALAHLMTKDYKTARTLYERLSVDEREPQAAARMLNMAALAALGDGDKTHATARWTEVARTRPLSYAALVARARLAKIGAPIPPAIDLTEPGAPPPPLALSLPQPVDLLHRIGLDADAESALHDREGAVTGGAGGRAVEALCAAYGRLGRARRRYIVSHTMPAALLASAPGPRNAWAWECAYPSPYEGHVRAVEAEQKLTPGLVYAVMKQESGYDPDAVSPARAVGLLQLLPETGRTLAAEMNLPHDDARLTSPPYNITLGGRYLKVMVDRFHGQLPLAVAAYNSGPEAIARWATRAGGMELDVFVERIPYRETRDYVGRVMSNLARYAFLRGGESALPKIELALGQTP